MKRYYLTTLAICLLVLLAGSFAYGVWDRRPMLSELKVGFIYENDESTPYTYNFSLAQQALEKEYGEQVQVLTRSNVRDTETEEPLRELVDRGCRIIFINSYSEQVVQVAAEYPSVQFCQVSFLPFPDPNTPENYHTFKGKIYQGRYVSGIAAGMKLRELIDQGEIQADEALVGYVAAYGTEEVISGFTSFLLGVRSVVPEATMRVRYTGTWSSFTLEKSCAKELIDEGCVIISQHTDTIGPAMACEEARARKKVFHVGYNQSMIDQAPYTSLISTRINWTPYITGAVGALLVSQPIEQYVDAAAFGRDMSAGFEKNWVEMLELNKAIAAEGTQARIDQAIDGFRKNQIEVFKGIYLGVNPKNAEDTIDLSQGYAENKESSSPQFHYILQDIITVED
ncbi:MAG: BMP family ABC transporter substrate-binding protein [Clostridia bacterium]|nr:BMP family ABC transporter substrate-binding protein [Clostridia bacterium]